MDVMNKMTAKDKYKSIKLKWKALLAENNKIRIRNAATQLNTSEASLLSTEIDESVSFLNINNYNDFLLKVLSMDKIMLLIRSDSVVHEKTIYTKDVKLKENKIIDTNSNESILEFDSNLFKYPFAQNKIHSKKSLRSFQIFDSYGEAILKIYLKGKDKLIFDEIENHYKSDYNYELQEEMVSKQLRSKNIKKNNIGPFKNIDKKKSYKYDLNKNILREILTISSKVKIPIQIYGIGKGTIQYHRDLVNKIVDFGPWINIIDKTFNLHAIENHLTQSTLNEYSSDSEVFYSIDFYDSGNNHVLGICSIKAFNKEFNKIINKINKPIKQESL